MLSVAEEILSIPELGQLVEVRRRQWVVANIYPSEPLNSGYPPQHLLTLASIEDDALGEELQVVWEIEPGAHIIEKAACRTLLVLITPNN